MKRVILTIDQFEGDALVRMGTDMLTSGHPGERELGEQVIDADDDPAFTGFAESGLQRRGERRLADA